MFVRQQVAPARMPADMVRWKPNAHVLMLAIRMRGGTCGCTLQLSHLAYTVPNHPDLVNCS